MTHSTLRHKGLRLALHVGIAVFFGVFLLSVSHAFAAFSYSPLAPLPGTTVTINGQQEVTNVGDYILGIFKLALGVCAVLAVLMIVIAGTIYIGGAASDSARSDAKDRIQKALIGLLIALSGWLILNTINPELTQLNFQPKAISATSSMPTINTNPVTPNDCPEGSYCFYGILTPSVQGAGPVLYAYATMLECTSGLSDTKAAYPQAIIESMGPGGVDACVSAPPANITKYTFAYMDPTNKVTTSSYDTMAKCQFAQQNFDKTGTLTVTQSCFTDTQPNPDYVPPADRSGVPVLYNGKTSTPPPATQQTGSGAGQTTTTSAQPTTMYFFFYKTTQAPQFDRPTCFLDQATCQASYNATSKVPNLVLFPSGGCAATTTTPGLSSFNAPNVCVTPS